MLTYTAHDIRFLAECQISTAPDDRDAWEAASRFTLPYGTRVREWQAFWATWSEEEQMQPAPFRQVLVIPQGQISITSLFEVDGNNLSVVINGIPVEGRGHPRDIPEVNTTRGWVSIRALVPGDRVYKASQ
jgi:hypothetical protein